MVSSANLSWCLKPSKDKSTKKYGYVNKAKEWVIDAQFDKAKKFDEGIAEVILDGKVGLINETGSYLTEPKYDNIASFKDGLAEVKLNKKIGLIDKTGQRYESCASAGIDPNRKGMDISQSFGSSSSYSRKYALSALFLLDDTKDADATNMHDAAQAVADRMAKPVLKVGTELTGIISNLKETQNAE